MWQTDASSGHGLRIASVRSTNIFLLAVPLLLEFVYSPLSCIFVQYQVLDTKRKGEAVCVKKSTLNTLRSFQRAAHKKYSRNPGSSEWVLKLTCQIYGTGERLGIIWTNLSYDHHLFQLCKHRNIQGKFLAAPPNLFPIDLNVHLRGSYKKLSFGSSSFWWFLAHSALAGNRLPVLQLQDPNQVYTAGFFVLKEKNKQKGTRKYEATRTLGTSTKNSNF